MVARVIPAGWPVVSVDDGGIRPAGPRDACFYCCRKVGQLHGDDCATVLKEVEYNVLFDGVVVGTYLRENPYFWTEQDCENHLNASSWCACNAEQGIVWHDPATRKKLARRVKSRGAACLCGILEFRFSKVTKPGPYKESR